MPQIIKEEASLGEVLQEWTIQEFEKHQRTLVWYIFMGAIGLALVFYGLFTGNFLFALIIVLFVIILFLQTHQEPRSIPFQITDQGLVVGTRFYPYVELEKFYVIYNPPEVKKLYIEPKSLIHPRLQIPLLDQNPLGVKTALREFLPEDVEKEEEPVSDRIARNWRIH
ncbi:MAG TPA: hypothetical protein VJB37_00165 [Patescibacteria group bacterium]|nr:hypothetical protein [Patescibacteria group bacterium]